MTDNRSPMPPETAYAYWIAILLVTAVVIRELSHNDILAAGALLCALVATGWKMTRQFADERKHVAHQRSLAVAAAGELLRVASLTGPEIMRDFAAAEPLHRARIEAVRRFFFQANGIGMTREEMLSLVSNHDPIVIRDVVNDLSASRSPWFDPQDNAWRTAVQFHANGHSELCHRPVDLQAWSRSLPEPDEYVSRK